MDEHGGTNDQQLGVAQPGQVGAHIVQKGVTRLATDTQQHQLDWTEGNGGGHMHLVEKTEKKNG